MIKTNIHNNSLVNKRMDISICLFLVISILLVYWQVQKYDFVNFDDNEYVTENRHVRPGLTSDGMIWAFTSIHGGNWHPVTSLSHMLDCQIFGLSPGWHHRTNLLFHILNALLLFIVFRKMTGNLWQSGFVAALFAIHPLHVESVAWISERKDVLSAFFWMLTMWGYARYVERPGVNRYLLVFLFFILGLMSKPMLVTLPFVLVLLDYWPLNRIKTEQPQGGSLTQHWPAIRHILIEKIPFFALVSISSVITFLVQKHSGAVNSLDAIPFNIRIANAIVSYIGYIGKTFWPSGMAVFYPHPGMIPWWKIIGAGIFLIAIFFLVIKGIKRHPYLAVGWFWYTGTLFPVIGIVQVGGQAMADRYTYIPQIGVSIIIAWGISELIKYWRFKKIFLSITTASALSTLMIITFLQVQYWKNSSILFVRALHVTSRNWLAHNNLGIALKNQGRTDDAINHYSEALRINPDFADAHYNMGKVLESQGRIDDAINHYSEALRINPDFAKAHNNLGNMLFHKGRIDDAINHYSEAFRCKPDFADAHNNMGNVLKIQGRVDDAINHYSEALRYKPDFADAHYNLGNVYKNQGRIDDAINHYSEALRINPDFADAHNNLGNTLKSKGRIDGAIDHYSEALRINPDFAGAHYNLGMTLLQKRDMGRAIDHFRKALQINPDNIQTKSILNKILMYQERTRQ